MKLMAIAHLRHLAVLVALAWLPQAVVAQPEADLENEAKKAIQSQFEEMYHKGVDDLSDRIALQGAVKPFAVAMSTKGTVKSISLRQAEDIPAEVALEIVRRSMVALVEQGKVGATAIFYVADNPDPDANAKKVLVVEMEHILGPTLAQLIPYNITKGKSSFGEPVVVEMKGRIFTDKNQQQGS